MPQDTVTLALAGATSPWPELAHLQGLRHLGLGWRTLEDRAALIRAGAHSKTTPPWLALAHLQGLRYHGSGWRALQNYATLAGAGVSRHPRSWPELAFSPGLRRRCSGWGYIAITSAARAVIRIRARFCIFAGSSATLQQIKLPNYLLSSIEEKTSLVSKNE